MSTVYILGAGASRHIGYPLASTMGTELLEWMRGHSSGRYRESAELIGKLFGQTPNIEDVITQLSSEIGRLTSGKDNERELGTSLSYARGQIADAIREWFRDIHCNSAPAYAEIATRLLMPRDVVITFNYDDSVERELRNARRWELANGYGFRLAYATHPSPVLVLKLHGSINWLASLFKGMTGGTFFVSDPGATLGNQPVIHPADAAYLGFSNFEGELYKGGSALPSLILPGRTKEFFYTTSFGEEWQEFWDSLWSQAAQALEHARKIVLAGYSLLPVDKRARGLILESHHPETRVTVVSGEQSEQIADEFRKAGFADVSFSTDRFEDWVRGAHPEGD